MDQKIATDDDDIKISDSDLESVREENYYRPKSTFGILIVIEEDISALSKVLFNSNEINEMYIMNETELLDKETGEKIKLPQVNSPEN